MSYLNDKHAKNGELQTAQLSEIILKKPTLQILIIENEYLIAMDAERILLEAFDCAVTIATLKNFQLVLGEKNFDVILLDFGGPPEPTSEEIAAISNSGALLVFTTAYDVFAVGVPGFENNPVVMKPYEEEQLLSAINSMLASRC